MRISDSLLDVTGGGDYISLIVPILNMTHYQRFTSLVLLLVLGVSVASGVPLHYGRHECEMGMTEMGGMMDCCQTAHLQRDTPEVRAARLCCALHCAQSMPTEPTTTKDAPRAPSLSLVLVHPAEIHSPMPLPDASRDLFSTHALLPTSQPAYIRHLALLI
jgi:hypothetical protein